MTDFVKVRVYDRLQNEYVIFNKEDIVLTEFCDHQDENIYKIINRHEMSAETQLWLNITKEEYDRLCKELGVGE